MSFYRELFNGMQFTKLMSFTSIKPLLKDRAFYFWPVGKLIFHGHWKFSPLGPIFLDFTFRLQTTELSEMVLLQSLIKGQGGICREGPLSGHLC